MSNTPLLTATDYHRIPMRILNRVLRWANALGLARFNLDPDTLLSSARQ